MSSSQQQQTSNSTNRNNQRFHLNKSIESEFEDDFMNMKQNIANITPHQLRVMEKYQKSQSQSAIHQELQLFIEKSLQSEKEKNCDDIVVKECDNEEKHEDYDEIVERNENVKHDDSQICGKRSINEVVTVDVTFE